MTHDLKCLPPFFDHVLVGRKTFEVRKNDRNFQPRDILRLREWRVTAFDRSDVVGEYTGREVERVVTYVLHGPQFGIEDGWCVMALRDAEVTR